MSKKFGMPTLAVGELKINNVHALFDFIGGNRNKIVVALGYSYLYFFYFDGNTNCSKQVAIDIVNENIKDVAETTFGKEKDFIFLDVPKEGAELKYSSHKRYCEAMRS